MSFHLAQCNIVKLKAPLDSPEVADFVAALDPINALADAAPGFVWRLKTDGGDATSIRVFADDQILLNMSVWESVEALKSYVYQSGHRELLRRRREWADRFDGRPIDDVVASRRIGSRTRPMPSRDWRLCSASDRPSTPLRSNRRSTRRSRRSRTSGITTPQSRARRRPDGIVVFPLVECRSAAVGSRHGRRL
jgi:hypothetical protein